MYIVIFKAEIKKFDTEYFEMAEMLQVKAKQRYNCLNFESYTENNQEIALSEWKSLEDIHNWKNDKRHKEAQQKGYKRWYKSYSVTITKVERRYKNQNETS